MNNKKNKTVELLLCIFLGCLGAHRFYRKDIKMGIVYFFTCGLFGIGWLVDLIRLIVDLIKSDKESNDYIDTNYEVTTEKKPRKKWIIFAVIGVLIVIIGIGAAGSKGNTESESKNTTLDVTSAFTTDTTTITVTTTTEKATSTTATTSTTTKATTVKPTTAKTTAPRSTKTAAEDNGNEYVGNNEYVAPVQSTYDYVINTNTNKYHRSTCSYVKRIKEENKLIINATSDEIRSRGYEPCQVCNP